MWNVRLARRQVRAFTQFSHPAVVPFVDVGTSGGFHYLAWPMAEGETLEARVAREGKLSAGQAAHVALQVAQGLTASHQHGLFHGLIKPSNIMLGSDGQTRVLDFGIGSLLVENDSQESLVDTMSTSNTLMSGLDCASPESIMEPTNRTPAGDQYSLGCVLYYCLSGQVPFPEGTAVEKMTAHQLKQPRSLKQLVPGLPDGLVAVVEKLMQKSPASRFGGTDEVVEALLPFAADAAPKAPAPRKSGFVQRPQVPQPAARPSPNAATPVPGSTHMNLPALPQQQPVQNFPPAPEPPPPPRPAVPGRNVFHGAQAQATQMMPLPAVPQAGRAAPAAAATQAMYLPPENASGGFTPGWVPEGPRPSRLMPVLFVAAVVAIVAVTYYLGKTYLFPQNG
jgi:serine/threonine-protein kinase